MSGPMISRRTMVKQTAAAVAVAAGAIGGAACLNGRQGTLAPEKPLKLPQYAVERPPGAPVLSLVHGHELELMVAAAVDQLGGIGRFIQPGDRVLLKPNVAFDRDPALGATTSPQLLKAIVKLCTAAGAAEVMVTDNPINSPEGCFQKSGITRACQESGARLYLPHEAEFQLVAVGGVVLDHWPVLTKPLLKANKVIGIAPCKDHNLSSASLAMKNWYGLLGGARNRFHQAIHDTIADLAQMITPTLVFVDGTRILTANGPTGGSLADVKTGDTLVCGVDQVAVDAWAYENLLQRDLAKLEYVHRAQQRGLGSARWREVNFKELTV